MAEFFFATAWAAGVLEGGSLLHNAKKHENAASPTMIFPSLLYGTASLPLGLIGASPGPSLVASFPFAPPISALESACVVLPVNQPKPANDGTKQSNRPLKKTEKTPTDTGDDQENPISSRSEMIRKVREDNRRSLAARRQQQPQPVAPPPKAATHPSSSSATTKLISTLDGRPLATPLAEAMRRARFLFIGAGLVMTMVSYEKSQTEERQQNEALEREKRLRGRDVNAIQSLVNQGGSKNGVVVRLVNHNESVKDLTMSKGVVIPVVYSVDSNEDVDLTTSRDTPYWNLGSTIHEWKQTPLTKDWLLHTSVNDDDAILVLEADVSPSSLFDYLSMQDRPSLCQHQPKQLYLLENAIWVSRILGMIAEQKGVLNDNETTCTPVNVLIGSGKRPLQLADTSTIYGNGPAAVGAHVWSIVERLHPKAATGGEAPVAEEPATSEDSLTPSATALTVPKSVDDAFSLLEYVGMKLREGGTHAATAVTNIFAKGDNMVYVLSDSPCAVQWLRRTMPFGWNIRGYDVLSGLDAYRSANSTKDGVTFVCCGNDEATCAMICSLLMDEHASKSQFVVLVREESCASTLRDLATDFNKETETEIVSVKGIHSNLFDQVRELLASGKTPSEAQGWIDSMK